MDAFVGYLVKNLVDDPDAVSVECRTGEQGLEIDVRVAPDDMARVIGRGGRTIQAVRTIVTTAAARHGTRARLSLIE